MVGAHYCGYTGSAGCLEWYSDVVQSHSSCYSRKKIWFHQKFTTAMTIESVKCRQRSGNQCQQSWGTTETSFKRVRARWSERNYIKYWHRDWPTINLFACGTRNTIVTIFSAALQQYQPKTSFNSLQWMAPSLGGMDSKRLWAARTILNLNLTSEHCRSHIVSLCI